MAQWMMGVVVLLIGTMFGLFMITLWLRDLRTFTDKHELALHKLNLEIADLRALESADGQLDETLSEAHQERMSEIDKRIAMMKNDLGLAQVTHHDPTEAEILHPGIQNLPHNKIADDVDLVEYAD